MRSLTRLVLALAMAAFGVTSADAADNATFYTVTYVEVVPTAAAQAAGAVRQYADATRKDTGAVRVESVQRVDRPNQFVVLASWTEAKAFEAHQAGAAMKAFDTAVRPLMASPNDTRLHQALSVDVSTAARAPGAVYAVTHVDVIPPRKDDAVVALKQLAEDSRKDAGHVRFDVVQQTNRPNHFTVVEIWKDRASFDAHTATPGTKRFREQLAPMSGSLYDERLYQALD
ncbi:MAG TPA: antibiotic biosynthesis monooxygenase [Candidatus Acidoferrum sp.]|nr:antibiotic biosynthesis monooxygenase [Candidatus Acidoferrum sp.]